MFSKAPAQAKAAPAPTVQAKVVSAFDRDGDGQVTLQEIVATLREEVFDKLTFDAPVVLGFSAACIAIQAVTSYVWNEFTQTYFSLWPWAYTSFWQPLTYFRVFSQVLGHGGWDHLNGNLTIIILVGPPCETAYGARQLLVIMLLTAFVTSICHYALAPKFALQLGASGIVFMLIMLNSLREHQAGKLRVSFLALLGLWVWKEAKGFVQNRVGGFDGISHLAHLFGAVVGALAGFFINDPPARLKLRRFFRRLQKFCFGNTKTQ
mmetsp:Transcript_136659/g.262614  ORF Transcript_136659/g.262614 Transcript_136659/m.262614 type:complete len:264 (+) Transcript_136659:66-857(+)